MPPNRTYIPLQRTPYDNQLADVAIAFNDRRAAGWLTGGVVAMRVDVLYEIVDSLLLDLSSWWSAQS